MFTITFCLSTAPDVVRVIVRVAAELFVTVFIEAVTGTVAAFPLAVIALLVFIIAPAIVAFVPIFNALAAEIPPEVLIAPVVEDVVSSVLGANNEALAPVPPIVRSVVAPAKAVKEVEAVVILVVTSGEVKFCTPVNVCPASVRAIVALVLGNVIVVLSVPSKVRVLFIVKVFPSVPAKVVVELCVTVFASAIVRIAEVAGAVIVLYLYL